MPNTKFVERLADRIDKIDRKNLEQYVLALMAQESFLNFLLDHVLEGVMVLKNRDEVYFLNRRIRHLLNIPDSVTKKKARLNEVVLDKTLLSSLETAIEDGREIFQKEFDILLPRPMIVRVTLAQEKMPSGTFHIMTLTNLGPQDMDTRERFKLENWESMLSLASGVAHEIGNPLKSLTIHLKLLTKMFEKPSSLDRKKVLDAIRIMEDETSRLDQIVRNFLSATRRKPIQFEKVQINTILHKAVEFMKPELKARKIAVREELDNRLLLCLVDSERLRQAFLNIIKNSVYAMPKGGAITVRTQAREKICMIQFQDTGSGISEEALPKIFDAYFTTKEQGSGLGLLIVYQIVREHGGRIEVSSQVKKGTTFTLLLPIRKEKLGLPEPKKGQTE